MCEGDKSMAVATGAVESANRGMDVETPADTPLELRENLEEESSQVPPTQEALPSLPEPGTSQVHLEGQPSQVPPTQEAPPSLPEPGPPQVHLEGHPSQVPPTQEVLPSLPEPGPSQDLEGQPSQVPPMTGTQEALPSLPGQSSQPRSMVWEVPCTRPWK